MGVRRLWYWCTLPCCQDCGSLIEKGRRFCDARCEEAAARGREPPSRGRPSPRARLAGRDASPPRTKPTQRAACGHHRPDAAVVDPAAIGSVDMSAW